MNKKNTVYIVIALVILLAIIYFISTSKNSGVQTNQEQIPTPEVPTSSSNSLPENIPTPTTNTKPTPAVKSAPLTSPKTLNVSIVNFSFNPQVLNIHKGDTVVWLNQDSTSHQITGGSFSSSVFSSGQNYSFTFNITGTFSYHCAIHPFMTGTIIVQ